MIILPKKIQASLHTLVSAQDTKESEWDLEQYSQLCEKSLTWRGKDSQQPTWQRRLKRENWLKHLSTRMLRPSHTKHFEDWWTSCLRDTRASLSVVPESEREKTTQDTCGHTSQTELLPADQAQSSSRTSKDTLPLGCVTSCTTWDEWVTEQRGDCSARLKSARPTNESESTSLGGFPTPTVGDSWTPSNEASMKREWKKWNLRGVGTLNWPTPRVSDDQGASSTRIGQPNAQLREKVLEGGQPGLAASSTRGKNPEQWPTPRAGETDENLETWEKRRQRKEKEGINLHKPLSVKVRQEQWPTPRAGNPGSRKPGTGGKVLSEEVKLVTNHHLNPSWVEQLMLGIHGVGWTQLPTEWTDLDCWVRV